MEAVVKLRKRHPAQENIIQTAKRFNVLKCGRRFGKTSLAEELVIEPALDGYPVAYYAPTYKDLNDFWINIKGIVKDVIKSKDEQVKQIRLITGGIIDMWSLDDPDSGRGRKYKRVVVDECEKAAKLKIAWNGTIRATLTDYKGDAWFLSTPQFGITFFKELHSRKDDEKFMHEWQGWTYTTYDNPHMDPNEIDAAKRTLDEVYFRCEYLAEDVDLKGLLWAFAWDKARHEGRVELNRKQIVYLSFDFNMDPMCCSVIQWYNNKVHIVETIKLPNSDTYALCDYIKVKYGGCVFIVTGDASGKNSNAMVKDKLNHYIIIKNSLSLAGSQIKVPMVNPDIVDNQVLFNSILSHYDVVADKDNAYGFIFDCKSVKMLPNRKIDKSNREDVTMQADALDTVRYWFNVFMGDFLKHIK